MLRLYYELMRRNVFKVGAAYGIMGWIVTETSGAFFPDLGLPHWTITLVLIVVLTGFPVAVFLAWTYEVTPGGIKKTQEVSREASVTPATGRKVDYIIIAALVLALGYFLWGHEASESQPEPLQTESGQD